MAPGDGSLVCPICSQLFSSKSSLVRHSKRCSSGAAPPSRRKSCRHCVASKSRCDLKQPVCGTCKARDINCEFATRGGDVDGPEVDTIGIPTTANLMQQDGSAQDHEGSCDSLSASNGHQSTWPIQTHDTSAFLRSVTPASSSFDNHPAITTDPGDLAPELFISEARRQMLLGSAPESPPESEAAARHIVAFLIRALRSWPRLMSSYHTALLPPVIHRLQLENGVPKPLANCYTLVSMWSGHVEGTHDLVRDTIVAELQRLLGEYESYGVLELLATAQSVLIMLIVLFFCIPNKQSPSTNHPTDAELLVQIWKITGALTATGLFLDDESRNTTPPWQDWAIVAAKRRTILALHHVEWAWSLLHGYPVLTCFELGPLPAPSPGFLWREENQTQWEKLYKSWLRRWPASSYKMWELFRAGSGDGLGARGEMWLAEADEFGMMIAAEINPANGMR